MSKPWNTTKLEVLVWVVIAWGLGFTVASAVNISRGKALLDACQAGG